MFHSADARKRPDFLAEHDKQQKGLSFQDLMLNANISLLRNGLPALIALIDQRPLETYLAVPGTIWSIIHDTLGLAC